MRTMFVYIIIAASMTTAASSQTRDAAFQTHGRSTSDSSMVFSSPRPEKMTETDSASDLKNAWGIDVMLSGNGFGLGAFYRHEYLRDLYGTITFAIADAKDDNEIEYYDWYGQSYVPNKVKRFLLMPLFFGAQYRLFADDITDSFRPYVNAGAGPALILSSPYEREYFNSLRYAETHYTAGGYVGFGAFFGANKNNLMGVNFRYYYIPVSGGIESMINSDPSNPTLIRKNDFGSFFITINLGSIY